MNTILTALTFGAIGGSCAGFWSGRRWAEFWAAQHDATRRFAGRANYRRGNH